MSDADLFLGAAALMMYVLVSQHLLKRGITAPMAFTLYGLLLGPLVLGVVHLDFANGAIAGIATFTLVLTLFTDAVRIDVRKLRRRHALPLRLLGIGLPLTMAAGTGLALLLFPALSVWDAALLGVILGPTDAALGREVVQNGKVPGRIRQALNVEGGLNDGLGLPFLLLAASFASTTDEGYSVVGWAAYQGRHLGLGALLGLAVGIGGTTAVAIARERDWLNQAHMRLAVLGLALLAYYGAEVAGGNGFVATFVCGMVIAVRSEPLQDAAHDFESSGGELFNLTVFMLFGAVLLPEYLDHITWRHVTFAVLALTALRIGPVAISLLGLGLMPVTLVFLGWFGPRGIASIIYLLIVSTRYDVPPIDDIGAVVVLTVLISVFAHGLTAGPLAALYAAHVKAHRKGAEDEACPTFPTR